MADAERDDAERDDVERDEVERDAEAIEPDRAQSGAAVALLKALGTLLGVHIQYAQREAADDFGRVAAGVALLSAAALFLLLALAGAHVAVVLLLARRVGLLAAVGLAAGGDALLGLALAFAGRGRLRRPILAQTRTLVKKTVASFAEM